MISVSFLALLLPATAMAQRVNQMPPKDPSSFSRLMKAHPAQPSAPTASNEAQTLPPDPAAETQAMAPLMSNGIVAVVNDAVISTSDLRARLGLALLSSGMPATPEIQKKLMPQVLRALIDEQLQLQEGKKNGISVSHEEILKAMEKIANDNKIPGGNIITFLESHGVPPSTLQSQIKSAITWNKLVMRELRPRVDVGDDEIENVIQRLRSNEGKDEYAVSEIFLSVDKPEDENAVRDLASKLAEQIRGGASFGALARQFSQGLGASSGGDLGWIQLGQLTPEIDEALQRLSVKDISSPVRDSNGYHILGLREKRTIALTAGKETKVKLQQAFRPFTANAKKEALLAEAAQIKDSVQGCDDLEGRLLRFYPLWQWQDLGEVQLSEAPEWLRDKAAHIPTGQASDPMATERGALILFVCERNAPEAINRDAIRSMIGTEKMEVLARRKQRDLRRDAYIDIRLK
jgi:peptidyl-prolyl cis-trans isomerase SurA